MDGNRVSVQRMIALLYICLSLSLSLATGKPLKSSNKTGGYTPVKQQSVRTITVGRNAMHAINEWNNNNFNHFNNTTKVSAKKEITSDSDSDSADSDSREWSLQFDPNYFASLNAANHRPIDPLIAMPSDGKSKVSSSSSSSSSAGDNLYYYSPETYGKATHKNHKTGSFAYLYPSSSTTTSTTTTTTTTPTPKLSDNRFGEVGGEAQSNAFSEPAPQPYSTPYNSNDKQSSIHYNYDETPDEEEEPNYYDTNEEIGRKYYYPMRNRHKQYSLHDYYGSDLSSMSTTNENSKIKAAINTPITSYGTNEEIQDFGHNVESHYESGGNVRFPSKYYGGAGTGAYYPSHYPSASYYPQQSGSEHSLFSGTDSLLHKSSGWIGPGIAGLLLGILPLGLLAATMLPAFMSVPIVSTATVGRRKRQISAFDILNFNSTQIFLSPGVLNIISRYGMSSLEEPKCLKEMFCTYTADGRDGKNSNTNLVQNILYNIIEWTPNKWAKSLGMDTLFNAIKTNKCQSIYKCMSRKVKFKETENIINN